MLVLIFIAGLVLGASVGIVLFSLLIAGKKDDDTIHQVCTEVK